MRIVQLAPYSGPYSGSFVPMLLAGARESRTRGHEPHIVLPPAARSRKWIEAFADEAVPVTFAAPSGRAGRAAIENLVSATPDRLILHSHFSAYDLLVARLAYPRRSVKAIWHVHSFLAASPTVRIRHMAKFALARAALYRVLVVSPELARDAVARLAPRRRTLYFPNAIDLSRFPLVDATMRTGARRLLQLVDEQTVLLHFGWDWRVKQGDIAVAAARELRRRGHDAVLVTVNPPREVRPGLERERGMIRVAEPTEDIHLLYAAADAYVAPSEGEGMPFAVLEALACGVPVVASDLPVHRRIADEVENCAIADDPGAIAAAVARFSARGAIARDSAARSARTWVLEHAALGAWAERLNDVYEAAWT